MMSEDSPDACWHCIITEHSEVGQGKAKYTQYKAMSTMPGEQPQELSFRFSQVDKLAKALEAVPDLCDVIMPRMPPKVTMRAVLRGRFDPQFLQQRQGLMQEFFDSLSAKLNNKYSEVGNVLDLCEPLGEFVRAAASRGADDAQAAINAVERAIQIEEDREIIATQEQEYEESLRMDELRQIAEAEQAEKLREEEARIERERLEEERRQAELAAEAERKQMTLQEDVLKRREAFEAAHGSLPDGVPLTMLRLRAPSGKTIQRKFPETMLVKDLFEFAAVADWDGPKLGSSFDLKTSLPVRSLRDMRDSTLKEADLCPSCQLLVAVDEVDSLTPDM